MSKKQDTTEQVETNKETEQKFSEVRCHITTLNTILDYLGRQPYHEVSKLINLIQSGFIPILPEAAKGIREVSRTEKDKK